VTPALVSTPKPVASHNKDVLVTFHEIPGFCTTGSGLFLETSGRATLVGCYELEWNTAEIRIDLDQAQSQDGQALPNCFGFDVQADLCLAFAASGDDDPRFVVHLTVDVLD
jgi:hypothetical protein